MTLPRLMKRPGWTCLVWLLLSVTLCVSAADPKRVLIIDSFERNVPPFSVVNSAFRSELARAFGGPLEFYEVPLDLARFSQPGWEKPFVSVLEWRIQSRPVDLVVVIGSPGVQFVARHREQLFPHTPVLSVGADLRLVPPDLLRTNATLVTGKISLPDMVEDILRLQPQTTNVVVVFGASVLEDFWVSECRREFQTFTNRVGFTWLNHLTVAQILERCAALPPHSFILHGLFVVDADKVPCEQYDVLRCLHEVANAPMYAIFASSFGLGPVGGRLYRDSEVGEQGARIAARILHGENLAGIPPSIVAASAPVYDWRELQRWGISEANLPAGSSINFRQPALWQQYRWQIVGVLVFCGLETMLIIGLISNKLAKKNALDQLRESEQQMSLAAAAGVGVWVWNIHSNKIWSSEQWRRLFGFAPGEDIGFEKFYQRIHPEDRGKIESELRCAVGNQADFLREYRIVWPGGSERWIASQGRIIAGVNGVPDRYLGSMIEITTRKQAEEKTHHLSHALEQSPVLVMITDRQGRIVYINQKFSEVTGYSSADVVGQNPRFLKSGESPSAVYDHLWKTIANGDVWRGEFHNRKKSGELYWEWEVISPLRNAAGKITHFVAIKEDITERKQNELRLNELSRRLIRAHEAERARLGRELHDDVTQRLAVLAIDAGRVELSADKVSMAETMRSVREGLVQLSEDVHALSYQLHPSILEDLGLAEALKAECERFSRQEGTLINLKLRDLPDGLPPDAALCLFRVAQEALRNVIRHAQARHVEITVRILDGHLQLIVHDDGVGFDSALQRARPSLGLASMRERVFLVKGELDIESAPGQGTTILLTLPLTIENDSDKNLWPVL